MKTVDFIVVGCGLAGISFIEQLKTNNKSVLVFDNASQQSSTVAGGLYNPVVLKRFTSVWKSKEQLELALPFYHSLEDKLQVKLDYKIPVLRRFTSSEEQNDWFAASDRPQVGEFLSTKIVKNTNPHIDAAYGLGEVLHTGRIDTGQLITSYISYLKTTNEFSAEGFDYDALKITESGFRYQNVLAKHIVFAEGFGVKRNPYFNTLPLNGTKGELITIKAPDLKLDYILKSSAFLIPMENDVYWVGATYEWNDKTNSITEKAKDELLSKIKMFITCDFKVINQVAGIRPTVKDRRPLVGEHPEYKNMYVLNGLGTRGVMIAPYVSEKLFNYIEHGQTLDSEIDIRRFNSN
ncbi:NAD(P)/FAD-dependent oxidoreductase [Formosa sp. S-31]|uniref:NAD(P)/FAD-dependent oxidoreductase n=1 Tax=Formosa sp. S-31 TaxID=2790949 RepID=UPI003EC10FCA